MAEPVIRAEQFGAPVARKTTSRFTNAWLVMFAAGLVAFVLFYAASSQNSHTINALVANRLIAEGESFSPSEFSTVAIHIQGGSSGALVQDRSDAYNALTGTKSSHAIEKGAFLVNGDYYAPVAGGTERVMSFDIDPADAVSGDVNTGDKVDIFNSCGVEVGYRLQIVGKEAPGSGGLGSSGDTKLILKVAVPDDQIGNVVEQTLAGKFKLVQNNDQPTLIPPAGVPPCGGGAS